MCEHLCRDVSWLDILWNKKVRKLHWTGKWKIPAWYSWGICFQKSKIKYNVILVCLRAYKTHTNIIILNVGFLWLYFSLQKRAEIPIVLISNCRFTMDKTNSLYIFNEIHTLNEIKNKKQT